MENYIGYKKLSVLDILKGHEGIKLWSSLFGDVILHSIDEREEFPIVVEVGDSKSLRYFTKDGKYMKYNLDCMLFPSEKQRNWVKFAVNYPRDYPMMCSENGVYFAPRNYYGEMLIHRDRPDEDIIYCCYPRGLTSKDTTVVDKWKYIIPIERFDPNDIKKSLEFNLVV